MAITFHPGPGQIKESETVKNNRPVIILTPDYKGRAGLVTVVPLGTKEPTDIMPYHYKLPRNCMPQVGRFQDNDSWVKADLIYTVAFHRLNLIRLGTRDPIYWQEALLSVKAFSGAFVIYNILKKNYAISPATVCPCAGLPHCRMFPILNQPTTVFLRKTANLLSIRHISPVSQQYLFELVV